MHRRTKFDAKHASAARVQRCVGPLHQQTRLIKVLWREQAAKGNATCQRYVELTGAFRLRLSLKTRFQTRAPDPTNETNAVTMKMSAHF